MDLQDVARPDQLRQEVAALEGVRGNDAQQRQLAELLMTHSKG